LSSVAPPTTGDRGLTTFNALDAAEAEAALLRCCGSSRWARLMAALRPFHTIEALTDAASDVWQALAPGDWMQAFAAHPRVGASLKAQAAGAAGWSADEQSGVRSAATSVRDDLDRLNDEYESRFGYRFVVCATGLSAEEALSRLKARLAGEPVQELATAVAEQARITELRLHKLLAEMAGD
jgi:OHCU decarboxylase